ncbi:MAG: alpha/beta fold hydrolase [Ignavibacteria bacterium]|jgi:pimeloyl-ACP methyl ester carboxylesterase
MKSKLFILLIIIFIADQYYLISQTHQEPVFVIVHGAWGGGWAFKEVGSLLTDKGCIVYRPTMTGQGERVHLGSTKVGLDTHIQDIVNTILFEDLHDIILVGHSYGGMVVTGVADRIAERLTKLIYVDAFVPEDGESLYDISGGLDSTEFQIVDGFIIPPWVTKNQKPPKDVPHQLKTLTDKISLKNQMRLKIPTTYILTVDKGAEPKDDDFASQYERAKKKGWPLFQLEADHNVQWSAPKAFSNMLFDIAQE